MPETYDMTDLVHVQVLHPSGIDVALLEHLAASQDDHAADDLPGGHEYEGGHR
jgi:hypothetical protein